MVSMKNFSSGVNFINVKTEAAAAVLALGWLWLTSDIEEFDKKSSRKVFQIVTMKLHFW